MNLRIAFFNINRNRFKFLHENGVIPGHLNSPRRMSDSDLSSTPSLDESLIDYPQLVKDAVADVERLYMYSVEPDALFQLAEMGQKGYRLNFVSL